MLRVLAHRGPDGSGVVVAGPAVLGHARLTILDPEGGGQPMASADGNVVMTFNGEIYNYLELKEELGRRGHVFTTRSDTEVLLHLYLEEGEDCVRWLNGQWSFAVWDGRSRKLFAARDRLGVRPLYWTFAGGSFRFASGIKALLSDRSVPRRADVRALDQILTFWTILPPRTFFDGISQVPPGCLLTLKDGEVRVRKYWQPDYGSRMVGRDEVELASELRELLIDAVRLRLRADVPVGAYLSGGLDSAITAALVRGFTGSPLRTFSVAFQDPEFDESGWQQDVIRHLDVGNHTTVNCRAEDIGRVFPAVAWHAEQPTVRTAPAPLFLLSRLVREMGYKVVVTGEGADEVFGGYDLFKEALVRRAWAMNPDDADRALQLRGLYPWMPRMRDQPDSYLRSFFRAAPEDLADPFFSHLPRWDMTSGIKRLLAKDVLDALEGVDARKELLAELPEGYSSWDPLCQAQYLETTVLLPGYILSTQGDRVSMAHSVEGRFPFLDPRVFDFGARLDPGLKIKGMDEKYLLKQAARDLVPAALLSRPKQPYRAPDATCFFDPENGRARFDWVEDVLSEARVREAGLFEPSAVTLLARKARAGRVAGVRDGMALNAILSAQLVAMQMIQDVGRVTDDNDG
jgi:asparagine synthase (glutamine-hydrolysing)